MGRLHLKVLGDEMKDIVMVVCPNNLLLHKDEFYVRYIFFGRGFYIDDPEYEECLELLRLREYENLCTCWSPCGKCNV